jgi:hypothetical protein
MVENPTVVPVVDLFYAKTRQKLVRFVVEEMGNDEELQKHDFMERARTKDEATRQAITVDDGYLVRYNVLDVVDPDVAAPFYEKADSRVMELLQSWPLTEEGREDGDERTPILQLLDQRGKCRLFEFFVGGRCNPEKAYSKSELKDNGVGNHNTTRKYLPFFVEAGLVEEVEGKRATRYKKGTNEDLEAFLVELNEALYVAYQTTVEA